MLSNATVKAARPGARPIKLWDAGGLHLLVMPTGHRAWRLRSRAGGRERVVTIGSWPEISIDVARDRAALVRAGAAPAFDSAQTRTFEMAARAWHAHMTLQWSATHAAEVLASLERDVFVAIGAAELDAIAKRDVLTAVRAVEQRGRRETAGRLRQRISAVFDFAMSEDWCEQNPAAVRRAMLKPAAQRPHPALVDIADCRGLLADVDALTGAPSAKLASRFLALTGLRWAAVRGARWDEIEELDGAEPLWRVPAARMKLAAAKKVSTDHDHLVPLAPAAVAVLREAGRFTGAGKLIFAGRAEQQLGERAIGDLYVRAGYAGRHVPHGWRASFSTIMNEQLPGERDAIDLALAHTPKREDGKIDKVEAAYNRSQHLPRRRRLLETWAQLVTG